MKKILVAAVAALALVLSGTTSAQAGGNPDCSRAGGFGWGIGLRLSGDCNWSSWRSCGSGGCGGAGPAMFPMGAPMMAAPAPMMMFVPGPAHGPAVAPAQLPAPLPAPAHGLAAPAQGPVNPAGYIRPVSYNGYGYIFPAVAPSYWR